jgi:coproporphyrinogen III oxidase-like Fe-S oxidoreductase
MSLRLSEGLSSEHYRRLTNSDLALSLDQFRLQALENEGFITFQDNILKAAPAGRQRLNAVLAHLLS